MIHSTLSPIRVMYGRKEQRASDYLSSTDTVKGIKPADIQDQPVVTARQLMAISESVFARDWNRPEEDDAWAYLSKGK